MHVFVHTFPHMHTEFDDLTQRTIVQRMKKVIISTSSVTHYFIALLCFLLSFPCTYFVSFSLFDCGHVRFQPNEEKKTHKEIQTSTYTAIFHTMSICYIFISVDLVPLRVPFHHHFHSFQQFLPFHIPHCLLMIFCVVRDVFGL